MIVSSCPVNCHSAKVSLIKLLLFSITTPTYLMVLTAKRGHDSSPIADSVFPIILGLSVLLAFYADQQQWGELLELSMTSK